MEHIKAWYNKAIDAGFADERDWYRRAHQTIIEIEGRTGVDRVLVAAIVAVLSPALSWEVNIIEAERVILLWQKGIDWPFWKSPAYPRNVEKAYNILFTGSTEFVSGPKVEAFFANLFDPETPDFVTLDRHALRVWAGEKGAGHKYISRSLMQKANEDYRKVAVGFGLLPSELQAITWTAYRHFGGDIEATEKVVA